MKMTFPLLMLFIHLSTASSCVLTNDKVYKGVVADCSNKNLRAVPEDLPRSIVKLILFGNHIQSLPSNVFYNYTDLHELNLLNNDLSTFSEDCFVGLSKLISLDLRQNRFHFDNKTFTHNVFKPLKGLVILKVCESKLGSYDVSFPSESILFLDKLQVLSLNTWPGEENRYAFTYLKSLKKLAINGNDNCNVQVLRNNTFHVLKDLHVESLKTQCYVTRVESGALVPLPHLEEWIFHVTYASKVALKDVTTLLKPFSGKKMKMIDFSKVQDIRQSSITDSTLNRKTLTYLLDVCVEHIVLVNNYIRKIGTEFYESQFSKCVQYIDLSQNHLIGDTIFFFLFKDLLELRIFDISRKDETKTIGNRQTREERDFGIHTTFSCPPNLQQFLYHNGGSVHEAEIHLSFKNCTNLWKMDMSYTGIYAFKAKVSGLSNVRYLDLSGNTVKESFFQNVDITGVETLKLDNSRLDFDITKSVSFLQLPKLKILSLSSTGMNTIPPDSFSKLVNVQQLTLRSNTFDTIPDEIFNMPSLAHLDMSQNAFRYLSDETISSLDEIKRKRGSFVLKISGNTFICSCSTLRFAQWIYETEVQLDANKGYPCILSDGTMTSMAAFNKEYLQQWRKCIGQGLFTITLAVFFAFCISLAAVILIKRNFPQIEHSFLKLIGYDVYDRLRREDFKYDAYICYDDSDYQWPCHCLHKELLKVDRNIRLYLPDFCEELGAPKAEAIIDAISYSWKVVIVISENSFTDEWFYFAIMSAVRLLSSRNSITSRILLLYKDDSPELKANIPDFLVKVLDEDNIINLKDAKNCWLDMKQIILNDSGPDLFLD